MSARGARYDAKLAGELTYWTTKPCKHGHISEREVRSGRCCECRRVSDRRRYQDNPEKARKRTRDYHSVRREEVAEKARLRREAMTEEEKAVMRAKARIQAREWRKNNPAHRNALKRKYVADKGQRTPKWADTKAIVEFYKKCPPGYHVDHIVPLRAKNACGLHVPHNLQYLPALENMRKNNRFLP